MIAHDFFDYQRGGIDKPAHCSPALEALRAVLSERWQFGNLGCYGVRPIRLGELPSTHSYGAAIDLSYAHVGRTVALQQVVPYLIGWSAEWHIQAVHDYIGSRIWRAGRTPVEAQACDKWWRAQRPDSAGMGQNWATYFHIEVHPSGWDDGRGEVERGIA